MGTNVVEPCFTYYFFRLHRRPLQCPFGSSNWFLAIFRFTPFFANMSEWMYSVQFLTLRNNSFECIYCDICRSYYCVAEKYTWQHLETGLLHTEFIVVFLSDCEVITWTPNDCTREFRIWLWLPNMRYRDKRWIIVNVKLRWWVVRCRVMWMFVVKLI